MSLPTTHLSNMKNLTQQKKIIKSLLENGYVSRNSALRGDYGEYITRLSAIMLDLKDEGWNFTTEYVKKNGGKDYVYKLVGEQPLKLEKYYVGGELVGTKIIKS